ncbi:MAG: peptidoglycan bridge formation glycyltransferase FemA/FemB family protein [Nibricoccus sp.]
MPTQPVSPSLSQASTIEVQVDGQTLESWSAILEQFEDASIYQSWAYGAVRWGAQNLSHLILRREGQVIAAAQLRIARVPVLPAGVAYLRWGPLCQRKGQPLDAAVVRAMFVHLQREYGQRRGLSLKVIANAFADEARAVEYAQAMTAAGITPEFNTSSYRTVVVDLAPAPEAMRKALDQKWRNQLNRSEKNDLVLEVSDGPAAYGEFLKLYKGMWERKRFETSVDPEEFGRMQDLLIGSARMQTFLAKKDGQAIGALVCSLMGTTAIYLLGATDEKARELKAAYFLQWQAMLWLKQQGANAYDLGGIDPVSNPGGYHFKSGFGGKDVTQLPPHSHPGGLLSRSVMAFINWRRRKA